MRLQASNYKVVWDSVYTVTLAHVCTSKYIMFCFYVLFIFCIVTASNYKVVRDSVYTVTLAHVCSSKYIMFCIYVSMYSLYFVVFRFFMEFNRHVQFNVAYIRYLYVFIAFCFRHELISFSVCWPLTLTVSVYSYYPSPHYNFERKLSLCLSPARPWMYRHFKILSSWLQDSSTT